MAMARMRTLPKALEHIRENDPGTALTAHALRMLVLSGVLPCVKVGVKRLIDVDLLECYLKGEFTPTSTAAPQSQYGTIRRLG